MSIELLPLNEACMAANIKEQQQKKKSCFIDFLQYHFFIYYTLYF